MANIESDRTRVGLTITEESRILLKMWILENQVAGKKENMEQTMVRLMNKGLKAEGAGFEIHRWSAERRK